MTEPRPETVRDVVVRLYTDPDNPMTIAELSRDLRIGRETVREHLIRAGVSRRAQKARGSRDEAMIAEAARRYSEDGDTLWEIANDMGKTATTVRAWLIEAGVERRRPGVAVDAESLQETIRLYEGERMTIDEVAAAQGLHPWTVRQRLVNASVPRRSRGRRGVEQMQVGVHAAEQQVARAIEIRARHELRAASPSGGAVAVNEEASLLDGDLIIGGSFDDLDPWAWTVEQ